MSEVVLMESRFGAYGKIPALGDFFRFGLSPEFVGPWDRWLQASLAEARASMGEEFQPAYMSAPIWRFSLPAGLAGRQAVAGILMPSVDQVGRMFPLTLAVETGAGRDVLADHAALLAVAHPLEETALDVLSEDLTKDGLAGRLADCPALRAAEMPPARYARLQGRTLAPVSPPFAGGQSVWSVEGAEGLSVVVADGLPDHLFGMLIGSSMPGREGAVP